MQKFPGYHSNPHYAGEGGGTMPNPELLAYQGTPVSLILANTNQIEELLKS